MVMYYQKNSDEDIPINFSLLEMPEKVLGQQWDHQQSQKRKRRYQ